MPTVTLRTNCKHKGKYPCEISGRAEYQARLIVHNLRRGLRK